MASNDPDYDYPGWNGPGIRTGTNWAGTDWIGTNWAEPAPQADTYMQKQRYCVYNTARETFLSLGVTAADTGFARLKGLIGKIKLSFDDGLWIVPSRGIHTIGVLFPLDLVYLDSEFRVIHCIESLRPFNLAPLLPQAASVLELPTHTIYSSQTQVGDQLLICVAERMAEQLNSAETALVQIEQPEEAPMAVGRMQAILGWFKGMFAKERRQADRHLSPGLSAYFWNGAAPEEHHIRDISPTGLYLVTKERWYPGTILRVTLRSGSVGAEAEHAIAVQSMAVRDGEDGVGLTFVLPEGSPKRTKEPNFHDGADRKSLNDFLQRFLQQKGKRT